MRQREPKKAAKQASLDKINDKAKRIKQAYAGVAATRNGRIMIEDIMNLCGFHTPSVTVDPTTGEINTNSTIYNEARRNIYLTVRGRIPPKYRNMIETENSEDE